LLKLGVQVRYAPDGDQNGLTRYTGTSTTQGIIYRWEGFLRAVNGGVEGVVVGAGPNGTFNTVHQQIMNTIN
jgi:hypothetical protein